MTGPDLIRLAEDLAQCGGIHRLTNCITAACHVFAEHERRAARTVEAWEDGPVGVGMSDKAQMAGSGGSGRAPAAEGWGGRPTDCASGRCVSTAAPAMPASISTHSDINCAHSVNPAPVMSERGERQPVPMRTGNALADEHPRGITHGPGSPIEAEHSGPSDMAKRCVPRFEGKRINPELDGDGA